MNLMQRGVPGFCPAPNLNHNPSMNNFNALPVAGMNNNPLEFNTRKNHPPSSIDIIDVEMVPSRKNQKMKSANNTTNVGKTDNVTARVVKETVDISLFSRRNERARERDRVVNSGRQERSERQERFDRSERSNDAGSAIRSGRVQGRNNFEPGATISIDDSPPSNTRMQQNNGPQAQHGPDIPRMNHPGIMFGGMMPGFMNMMMAPGMGSMGGVMNMMDTSMLDPSIMGMGPPAFQTGLSTNLPAIGASAVPNAAIIQPVLGGKEIVQCKSCTLFPPNPSGPLPTTRERPNGCRTVFVGGLPENITEVIISEIFERCGEITTLRLSKKNFCHIRFVFEHSVDSAIYLSGYRVRIGENTDTPNCGRLHVDFAQARDDQYEFECRQRQLQREQRHRERMEQDRCRPASPPLIAYYNEHEAASVCEKIKQDDSFSTAVQVIITWLERGDCNKRNVNTFYSMIQSTNSHIRRLLTEKSSYEEEMQKAKDMLKVQIQGVMVQFTHIEKVFAAASHKKVWDHFTKAQRKNIEMWKKQASELRNLQIEELFAETGNDEMDVSDIEDDDCVQPRKKLKNGEEDNHHLKEENDSLRCQLEAYKNEVDLLKMDMSTDSDHKNEHIQVFQDSIRKLQQDLYESKRQQAEYSTKVRDLESKLKAAHVRELLLKTKIVDASKRNEVDNDEKNERTESDGNGSPVDRPENTPDPSAKGKGAKYIGLTSAFLNVHPFGASTDYIWSYLQKIEPSLKPSEVEAMLKRFPTVFRQELIGIGAKMERKWFFNGFVIEDTKAK